MTAIPCREQVVAAVKALLLTAAPSGCKVERNRRTDLSQDDLPSAILFEDTEIPNDTFTGEDAFDLSLIIQVALAHSGEEGATACNTMRATLTKALLADRTLGGLARDLSLTDPGDWIGVSVDSDDCEGFVLAMTLRYATVENDPFTFSN